MTNLPTISRHLNATTVTVNGFDFYFSYETVIAFRGERGLIVRRNDWGPTTGKHLNAIDGGSKEAQAKRLDGDAFEQAYRNEVEKFAPAPTQDDERCECGGKVGHIEACEEVLARAFDARPLAQ